MQLFGVPASDAFVRVLQWYGAATVVACLVVFVDRIRATLIVIVGDGWCAALMLGYIASGLLLALHVAVDVIDCQIGKHRDGDCNVLL